MYPVYPVCPGGVPHLSPSLCLTTNRVCWSTQQTRSSRGGPTNGGQVCGRWGFSVFLSSIQKRLSMCCLFCTKRWIGTPDNCPWNNGRSAQIVSDWKVFQIESSISVKLSLSGNAHIRKQYISKKGFPDQPFLKMIVTQMVTPLLMPLELCF